MYKRQRLLLTVIQKLHENDRLDKLALMKCIFLISQEIEINFSMYGFHPYKFGPYSSKIQSDINYLNKSGFIEMKKSDDKTTIKELSKLGKENILKNEKIEDFIMNILNKNKTTNHLIRYVYMKYPEYTIKSQLENLKPKISLPDNDEIFLIGYEGIGIDIFLNKLVKNNINIVIDVRNNARSMKYDFNKKRLNAFLEHLNIEYIHRPDMGIISENRKNLKTKEDYEKLFSQYRESLSARKEGLEFIKTRAKGNRIALMCFEKDVEYCHRREIGKYFQNLNYLVSAI